MRAYLTGVCLPGERNSIEPMAARVDPRHVRARHQSMHHFVANAPWDGGAVLRVARDWVLEPMARPGPVAAWIVDDTAYPKKGRHSVGVARQYCGPLGKPDNCQVAVSVSLANDAVSLPVAYRLYTRCGRPRSRWVGLPMRSSTWSKVAASIAQQSGRGGSMPLTTPACVAIKWRRSALGSSGIPTKPGNGPSARWGSPSNSATHLQP